MHRRLVALMMFGVFTAACSGNPTSPSLVSPSALNATPTPSPAPPVPTPPAHGTMTGRVTETAPTSSTGIAGAMVRVVDGPSGGRSVTADRMGFYSLADVSTRATVTVTAPGYLETTRTLDAVGDARNFQLMPVPTTKTATMSDSLDDQVGNCNDGASMKPCHIMAFPVHNGGKVEAVLTWDADGQADLDLSLFPSGTSSFISRSASRAGKTERITVEVPPGSNYDLRVTYASGTCAANYRLNVTYPN